MSDLGLKEAKTSSTTLEVVERMVANANRHDLHGVVACFSRDFQSEQPFHPERNFVGKGGVRKNGELFTSPGFQVDVLSMVVDGDTVWSELYIHGTQTDGKKRSTRGVTIQRVREGLIVWARLYVETWSESRVGTAS